MSRDFTMSPQARQTESALLEINKSWLLRAPEPEKHVSRCIGVRDGIVAARDSGRGRHRQPIDVRSIEAVGGLELKVRQTVRPENHNVTRTGQLRAQLRIARK